MATSELTRPATLPRPSAETRPPGDAPIGLARSLRRRAGAGLEYLWELSASLRRPRAELCTVDGTERSSGRPLRILYFGHGDNLAFLLQRAYEDYQVVERRSKLAAGGVRGRIRDLPEGASLLCVDLERLYGSLLSRDRFLRIPQWVRQKYAMRESWEEVLASLRKNTRKTDLRKVRKYGFSFRITRSEPAFRAFYHRMYRPYLRERFGEEVIIEPEWKVLRQCRKGEILEVLREERVVAAVLLHRLEGRLAFVWIGVPAEVRGELLRGAFSALYYFTLLVGYETGCREIDFLGTRPLLQDGLFRYKRKWGTYLEDSPVPRGDILLRPLRFDDAVRGFLAANPLIVRAGKSLVGKVLLEGGSVTREMLEEAVERLHTPGLSELRIFSRGGFEPEAREWGAAPSRGVSVRDLRLSTRPADDFCRL